MPLIRAWTRRPLVWQLTFLSSILILICGALAASLIAVEASHSASREAKSTALRATAIANCINNILGSRTGVQSKDSTATTEWVESLNNVLNAQPGPKQDAAFVTFEHATATYVQTLETDQNYRVDHPLGRC